MPEAAAAEREWLTEFKDVISDQKTGRAQVRAHKQAAPEWVPIKRAPEYPFLSINLPAYQIVQIDVDNPDCDEDPIIPPAFDIGIYDWLGIAAPNFVVESNPPKFHAFWVLRRSLPFKATPESLNLLHDIRQKLNQGLGGDPANNLRGSARSPAYERARVLCFTTERRNLNDINPPRTEIPHRVYKNKHHQYREGNRNRCTFEVLLRRFKEKGEKASVEELFDYAVTFQNLCDAENLPDGENLTIARNVIRNGHRYGISADRNYGAMGLEPAPWDRMTDEECQAEIKRRQRLGIQYVNDMRKKQTREWLKAKAQQLQLEGHRVTKKALAKRSRCYPKTVRAHWPYLF